jgi:N-acetylglucosamine kinase-like BadF-type ATPase
MSRAARDLVLGVDGGGTTTVAWLAETDSGRVVGRGVAGPSNAKAVGPDAARAALDAAREAAFSDAGLAPASVAAACLGLAGFDRPDDRALLTGWVEGWARRILTVNDAELVLAAGTPEGWGIAVIAGTGSICVGKAPDGTTTRAGGWGHIIGDEGSAYGVAIEALRRLARRHDGRDPTDGQDEALAEEVCRALGVETVAQLVSAVYAPGMDRARLAAVGPAVVRAADRGAPLALVTLDHAAHELSDLIGAVVAHLDWTPHDPRAGLPLAIAGSFLLHATRLVDRLVEKTRRNALRLDLRRVAEPAAGAVQLARRAIQP